MQARFRSWWKRIIITVATYAVIVIVFIATYQFGGDWTGFNSGYGKETITKTIHGNTIAIEKLPAKTLWDWMNFLLIASVTSVVAFLSNTFNKQQKETELTITQDNQRETMLQAYIDKMSELLLEKKLRKSKSGDEIRSIALACRSTRSKNYSRNAY
jgi:hypothetical protein